MRFFLGSHLDLHRQVGQALQLEPCEDPLHSVAARDAVDKKAGVYEAVNKPSGASGANGSVDGMVLVVGEREERIC